MITREFTIYKIENQQNGRCYIGCTEKGTRRIKQHFSDLHRGKHKSKAMQADFNKGDTFRAVSLFAFSATVTGKQKNDGNGYYIASTAHAIEKYYIRENKADIHGYNGNYYVYLYNYPNEVTAPENARHYLAQKIRKTAVKEFCALYPTKDKPERDYKPIDLYFSMAGGVKPFRGSAL